MIYPQEFALFPPVILDTISTNWLSETGNNLLAHYTFGSGVTSWLTERPGLSLLVVC